MTTTNHEKETIMTNTPIDPRQPAGVTVPIYRSSSSSAHSVAPAGGEVPKEQYTGKTPAQPKPDVT
jgi:hypothetical protein